MYCESCGSTIPDDVSSCPNCGVSAKAPAVAQAADNAQPVSADSNSAAVAATKEPTNKTAVAGLVLGIIFSVLSIVPYTYKLLFEGWGFFLFIIPLFGLAFSVIGLKNENGSRSSKAVAGIILSVVSSIVILCAFFFVFVPAVKYAREKYNEWFSDVGVWSPNGLLDTGYMYEEKTGLDFSYDGNDIISLHIDSYDIAL